MSDRGQYRSITVVLLDGPDFQQLTPEARWVFTVLKISMGPSGIEVWYPEALVAVLVARTGYTDPVVRGQLDALQGAGWLRTDRNLVWIVKQLQYEPAMTSKNEKHRTSIRTHVLGLPRLALVGEFARHYQTYLEDWEELAKSYPKPDEAQPVAYTKAIDSLSNHRDIDRGPNTETEEVSTTSADAVERRDPEHTLRSCIGLVVEHLYSGNRPPEAAMRNEASIARQLGERHGFDVLARGIQGLARRRDSGEFPNVKPRQVMSLKWINSKKFDINQLAASEDAYYRSDPEPRRGRGKVTDIGDIVASITPRAG